jgi:hypothetical protein
MGKTINLSLRFVLCNPVKKSATYGVQNGVGYYELLLSRLLALAVVFTHASYNWWAAWQELRCPIDRLQIFCVV